MKDWIQSFSGRKVVPSALTPEMVGGIEEIAHTLATKIRFTGQTPAPYSVGQHCVQGSRLLSPVFAGAFLLHELGEVFLPEIVTPLKPFVRVFHPGEPQGVYQDWADLEREHTRVILQALGLASIEPLIYSPEVKAMDIAMLAAEKQYLFPSEVEPWNLGVEPAATDTITPWTWQTAETEFLRRFHELFDAPK